MILFYTNFSNIILFIYLFILACSGSSLLHGVFSRCGMQASHCDGFSCCGAWALGCTDFQGPKTQRQEFPSRGKAAPKTRTHPEIHTGCNIFSTTSNVPVLKGCYLICHESDKSNHDTPPSLMAFYCPQE